MLLSLSLLWRVRREFALAHLLVRPHRIGHGDILSRAYDKALSLSLSLSLFLSLSAYYFSPKAESSRFPFFSPSERSKRDVFRARPIPCDNDIIDRIIGARPVVDPIVD